jgi:hypothetical protein
MDDSSGHTNPNVGAVLLALVLAVAIGWDVYRAQGDPPADGPAITQSVATTPVQPADMETPAPVGVEPNVTR